MTEQTILSRIDKAIRFFLYVLIFWLPYSPAVIEISVITALILWIIKRGILLTTFYRSAGPLSFKEKFFKFFAIVKPPATPLNRQILFFVVVCILSVIHSRIFAQSLRGFFTKTMEWFVVYFLVIEGFTSRKHVLWALGIYIFTAFSTGIDSLIQYYITGKDIFLGHVLTSRGATAAFDHANGLAAYLCFAIPISFSLLFFKFKKTALRVLFLVVFLVLVLSFILTFSRSGWLAMALTILVVIWRLEKKTISWLMLLIFLSSFLTWYLVSKNTEQQCRFQFADTRGAARWRLELWESSFKMIKDHPVLGHGLNTFMELFQAYRRKFGGRYDFYHSYAHNCYLQVWAETGIFGLIGFLSILFGLFRAAFRFVLKESQNQPKELITILGGLTVGAIAFLTHSFFDVQFYSLQLSIYFWVMAGIMVAICRMLKNTKEILNN